MTKNLGPLLPVPSSVKRNVAREPGRTSAPSAEAVGMLVVTVAVMGETMVEVLEEVTSEVMQVDSIPSPLRQEPYPMRQ